MAKIFEEEDISLTNPVALTVVSGISPMAVAVGLVEWLEECGATIANPTWQFQAEAVLIEDGIAINFENVDFSIRCSPAQVVFTRVSGEEVNFWALCKLFLDTEG